MTRQRSGAGLRGLYCCSRHTSTGQHWLSPIVSWPLDADTLDWHGWQQYTRPVKLQAALLQFCHHCKTCSLERDFLQVVIADEWEVERLHFAQVVKALTLSGWHMSVCRSQTTGTQSAAKYAKNEKEKPSIIREDSTFSEASSSFSTPNIQPDSTG